MLTCPLSLINFHFRLALIRSLNNVRVSTELSCTLLGRNTGGTSLLPPYEAQLKKAERDALKYDVEISGLEAVVSVRAQATSTSRTDDNQRRVHRTRLPNFMLSLPESESSSGRRQLLYGPRELTFQEWLELCDCKVPFYNRVPCFAVVRHLNEYASLGMVPPVESVHAFFDRRFFWTSYVNLWRDIKTATIPPALLDRVTEGRLYASIGSPKLLSPLHVLVGDHRSSKEKKRAMETGTVDAVTFGGVGIGDFELVAEVTYTEDGSRVQSPQGAADSFRRKDRSRRAPSVGENVISVATAQLAKKLRAAGPLGGNFLVSHIVFSWFVN